MDSIKPRPGRPRKYGRPSRAVTITLPEDVITQLQSIDGDLGSGIVSLASRRNGAEQPAPPLAELLQFGNHSLIVVTPLAALRRLPGVQLVPIGKGRALISLTAPHSIAELELAMRDAADHSPPPSAERQLLESVADILRSARQSPGMSLKERTIIVLQRRRQRRRR